MKNFIQSGNIVPVTAPAGGVVSGGGVLIGNLFGIANITADAGMPVEISTVGVFDMTKAGGAIAVGAKVYWDATAKVATGTASGNSLIGTAILGAASGDAAARVRLNGFIG